MVAILRPPVKHQGEALAGDSLRNLGLDGIGKHNHVVLQTRAQIGEVADVLTLTKVERAILHDGPDVPVVHVLRLWANMKPNQRSLCAVLMDMFERNIDSVSGVTTHQVVDQIGVALAFLLV